MRLKKFFLPLLLAVGCGEGSLGPPEGERERVVKGVAFLFIEPGTFEMGDLWGDGDDDERPVHTVEMGSFWMGKYEVTNAQFADFLNAVQDDIAMDWELVYYRGDLIYDLVCTGCRSWEDRIIYDGQGFRVRPGYEYHPVTLVTWYGAMAFSEWLGGRLPTEAEWEYAARAGGMRMRYPWGDEGPYHDGRYWMNYDPGQDDADGYWTTAPVGSFPPNALGLYDMAGNVWEWCLDWYGRDFYSWSPGRDPSGPLSGLARVLKGGSWGFPAWYGRASCRAMDDPIARFSDLGFRVVLPP
ncbi:MAG TPA: formylglycine-generating enzyme family protein [Candidatus Latescibacteria bacterium]|nr:formylglycine-generating enzyme family protein [Candidatus Latescibacterota bacterium]